MIEKLGTTPLFLGVESINWRLQDFVLAARNAKSVGATSLIVKVADGGNIWGDTAGGWKNILAAIEKEGISAIPYAYCYGNKFGALQIEISLLSSIMKDVGIVIADMEIEYNGQIEWAEYVCNSLKDVHGIFGVTTWADPNLQSWHEVLQALSPAVNFWLPQVYSNYLSSVYHAQFDPYKIPYYPVLNLGTDAGDNNLEAIANSSNSPIICFWEYSAAVSSYSSFVKRISQSKKVNTMNIPQNWQYTDKILTAPNSVQVKDGFCQWILSKQWDSGNFPLTNSIGLSVVEQSNPALGGGTVQPFRKTVLVWTEKTGVYEMWVGQEYVRLYQLLNGANAKIKSLENDPKFQDMISILTAITNSVAQISTYATEIKNTSHSALLSLGAHDA